MNTYEHEEAEVAINMLAVFVEEFKDKFALYVNDTYNLIVPLVT